MNTDNDSCHRLERVQSLQVRMVDVTTFHVPGPHPLVRQILVVRDYMLDGLSPLDHAVNILILHWIILGQSQDSHTNLMSSHRDRHHPPPRSPTVSCRNHGYKYVVSLAVTQTFTRTSDHLYLGMRQLQLHLHLHGPLILLRTTVLSDTHHQCLQGRETLPGLRCRATGVPAMVSNAHLSYRRSTCGFGTWGSPALRRGRCGS